MYTATIRQRGQLTLPESIRSILSWIKAGSVVSLEVDNEDGIRIRPYVAKSHQTNWGKIWDGIELARSFKGKRGNLSQFVIEDRQSH